MQVKLEIENYIFNVNQILRSIFPTKSIGQLYGTHSISYWLDRLKLERVFDFSSSQFFGIDHTFLSNLRYDVLLGYDPFNGMNLDEVEKALVLMNNARLGAIIAVPTIEHHIDKPTQQYTLYQWTRILKQTGSLITIYISEANATFLMVKK